MTHAEGSAAEALGTLAKDCLDVGVFTNQLEPMLEFWQQDIGLEFDHMLPVGGGVRQHRHDVAGSVFKLNHSRNQLAAGEPRDAGYLRLLIARAGLSAPIEKTDPDGNRVLLVPPGYGGVTQWAIEVATGSVAEFNRFYVQGIGLPVVNLADSFDEPSACAVACGRSLIIGRVDAQLGAIALEDSQAQCQEMRASGIRYTTIQVQKADAVYAQVLANGGLAGREPATLGSTARICFVRDRRGNWMELSQRASLVGSLASD